MFLQELWETAALVLFWAEAGGKGGADLVEQAGTVGEGNDTGLAGLDESNGLARGVEEDVAVGAGGEMRADRLGERGVGGVINIVRDVRDDLIAGEGGGDRGGRPGEIAAEALAEPEAGAMKTDFGRRGSEAEDGGSLGGGTAFDVAEGKDGRESGRQLGDGAFEEGALFAAGDDRVGRLGPGDRGGGEVERFGGVVERDGAFRRAKAHEGVVVSDAEEPGAEARAAVEPVEVVKGVEEGILDDVFGGRLVVENAEGEAEEGIGVGLDAGATGGEVARAEAGEELGVLDKGIWTSHAAP